MKNAMKSAAGQIASLWSKPKPVPKAPPAKVRRMEPSPGELALAKYSGDPAIVAAHAAWGSGRLWPQDKSLEQKAAGYFQLSADKIVGVLGCGTGAAAVALSHQIPCFIYGYDWRSNVEIPGTEFVKTTGAQSKVQIRSMSLDTVIPPLKRCAGLVAIEPVLTRAQDPVLDWVRLAMSPGAQVVFEEPSLEHQVGLSPTKPWFADMGNEQCTWASPGARQQSLKQVGLNVQNVQETTGTALRSLRSCMQGIPAARQELDDAIKLAPILEPVREFFNKEVEAAKNRLNVLENGDVAVYRYRVIKQRADG